jgi:hypothetical protein
MPSILTRQPGSNSNIPKAYQSQQPDTSIYIPPLTTPTASTNTINSYLRDEAKKRSRKPKNYRYQLNTNAKLPPSGASGVDVSYTDYPHTAKHQHQFVAQGGSEFYELNATGSSDRLNSTMGNSYTALLTNETNYVNYTRFINQIINNKMTGADYASINNTNASLRSVKEFLESKDQLLNKSDSSLSNVNSVLKEIMKIGIQDRKHRLKKFKHSVAPPSTAPASNSTNVS